jgi:excisionase family DNA binding protein
MGTEKNFITIEASEFLSMSVAWLRAQVFRRKIPFYKIGSAIRFSKIELMAYLQKRKQEPQG